MNKLMPFKNLKQSTLILIMFFSMVTPVKSKFMTIGFYVHGGETIIYKWDVIDYRIENITKWDSMFSGYFAQTFVQFNKIYFGFEYGKNRFYHYSGQTHGSPGSFETFSKTYKAQRALSLVQFKIKNRIWIQSGAGIYIGGPEFTLKEKKNIFPAIMASVRYHLKITSFIELPFFLRIDYHGMYEKPIGVSLGAGLVFRWKSGL